MKFIISRLNSRLPELFVLKWWLFYRFALFSCFFNVCNSEIHCQISESIEVQRVTSWVLGGREEQLEKVFDTLEYSIEKYKDLMDYRSLADLYNAFGRTMVFRLNDFTRGRKYVDLIKDLADLTNDPIIEAEYHNTLGELYHFEHGDLNRAFQEFEAAKLILNKYKKPLGYGLLNNYGLQYLALEKPDSALLFMKQSFEVKLSSGGYNNPRFLVKNALNSGVCYIYLNKLDSAEFYFKKAINIVDTLSLSISSYKLGAYVYLGVFYQENNRLQEAITVLTEAKGYLQSSNSYRDKALLYEGLTLCYAEKGDYLSAFINQSNQKKYLDSISLLGIREQIVSNDYLNMVDSLEHEKEILELKNDVSDQKRIVDEQLNQSRILKIASISIFSILVLLVIIYIVNRKRKMNLILVENERLENERLKREGEIEILRKENALMAAGAEISIRKNEMQDIKNQLVDHVQNSSDPEFHKLRKFLKQLDLKEKDKDQLLHIEAMIDSSEGRFFSILRGKHKKLTTEDVRLCALLKMNISTPELADIFKISAASLRTKKYRLKIKLGLESGVSIENYLSSF